MKCASNWFVASSIRRSPIAMARSNAVRLVVAVAILCCCSFAQDGDSNETHPKPKWLECFVDWIYSEETVGPGFSLQLSFHGSPIAGAPISLSKSGSVVSTARTNSRGVAHFSAVPPGEYHPGSPDGLLFPTGSLVIEVKADHASGEKLKLDWPGDSVTTQNLRGKFTTSDELSDPAIPLRNAPVELLDPYTSKLIESGHTDVNGDYEFATRVPGVYALRLKLAKKDESGSETHDLSVELDPGAKEYSIPEMKAVHSDCNGLQLLRKSETEDRWEAQ
jgi:hypothetical protein